MKDNFPSEVERQVKGTMKNLPSETVMTREQCQRYNYDESGFYSGERNEIPKDPPDNEPKMPDGNRDID